MKCPEPLRRGDVVGFVSTARFLPEPEIERAVKLVEALGFRVEVHPFCSKSVHQFGGSDSERATAFNQMLNRPDIKALFAVRGGYGTVRMIDGIDFSLLKRRPIWICGYSDLTILHGALSSRLGMMSLHCSMPVSFAALSEGVLEQTFDFLTGARVDLAFGPTDWDVPGRARGRLAGGNLSVLCSALGSPDFPDLRGAILFLEDVDEYYYHIDRMLRALLRSGSLDGVKGLVLGGLSLMKDHEIPFGQNGEEIVRELFSPLGIPLAFGFPAGHVSENRPLVLGAEVELISTAQGNALHYVDR